MNVSFGRLLTKPVSPWMNGEGPDNDIVLSSEFVLQEIYVIIAFPTSQNNDE